jgi:hypothetical protein
LAAMPSGPVHGRQALDTRQRRPDESVARTRTADYSC